jgi:hypothetical protein
MDFVFTLTEYNDELFKPQVSKALEKRTELVSRKKCPNIWRLTDKLNSKEKAPEEVLKKRHTRYRVYGIILLLLGLFLLIPSLTRPDELMIPLIVGAFSSGVGIAYINRGKKTKKVKLTAFDKAAIRLFNEYKKIPAYNVTFTDDKIQLKENAVIDYREIEYVFITEDLFVLIWNGRITVLQKKDLVSQDVADFVSFISNKSQDLFEVVDII